MNSRKYKNQKMTIFATVFIAGRQCIYRNNLVHLFRVLRRVGQSGDADVRWEIRSHAGAPNPASTFNVTSGTIKMPNGLDTVLLPIRVSHFTFFSTFP